MNSSENFTRLTSADVASRVPPSGGTNIQFKTAGYRVEFGNRTIKEFGREFRPFFDLGQMGSIDTDTFRGQFYQGQEGYNRRIPEIGHLMADAGIMLDGVWPKEPDLVRVLAKKGETDCDYVCDRLAVIDASGRQAVSLWVPRLKVRRKDASFNDDLVSSDGMIGYWKRKATKKNDRQLTAALYVAIKYVERDIDSGFVYEEDMGKPNDGMRRGGCFAAVDLDLEWEESSKRNYLSQIHPGFRYVGGRMVFDDSAIGGPTKQELIKAKNKKYQGGTASYSRKQET